MAATQAPAPPTARKARVADGTGHDHETEELYRAQLPRLTAFARARGAEDPEGLASTVLHDSIQRFEATSDHAGRIPMAYLYRSLRNRLIDEYRRRAATLVPLSPVHDGTVTATEPDEFSMDGFQALLDQLSPAQRDVIAHRFLGGYSVRETAHRLGRSQGAVRRLQFDALERLRAASALSPHRGRDD